MVLAREGVRSILIESDRHPRFHVGESLLPHSLPMFDRLGVHDAIRALPHTLVKPGATFCSHDGEERTTFWFDESAEPVIPNAYNVRRDEFDDVLLREAATRGVDVRERWKAIAPEWEGDAPGRRARAHGRRRGGDDSREVRARRHRTARVSRHAHGMENGLSGPPEAGDRRPLRRCGAHVRPRRGQHRDHHHALRVVLADPVRRRDDVGGRRARRRALRRDRRRDRRAVRRRDRSDARKRRASFRPRAGCSPPPPCRISRSRCPGRTATGSRSSAMPPAFSIRSSRRGS